MATTSTPATGPAQPLDDSDLLKFAWFPRTFEDALRELAGRAQQETWETDPTTPLNVLSSYARYTFKRLAQEGKLVTSVDNHGLEVISFNTGLFTDNYEAIFALLEKNQNPGRQPWVFKDWLVESDWRLDWFSSRAKPARYFDEPADLIYNPDLLVVANLDHILDDNADRYPADLRANRHRRRMMLQSAIAEAGKRAQMNYKVAVPQFYFGRAGGDRGWMQLLLPLCFDDPRRADLALVVDRADGVYRAFTVLALDMAYRNARLIARPESDWLPIRSFTT
jgi:hypothetical protein